MLSKFSSDEFTIVSKNTSNSAKKLLNPLFNTITDLRDSKALSSLPIEHKSTLNGDEVYYISLPEPTKPRFFPDFIWNDSHLTINQYYKRDKIGINNGLGTIHYTESHKNHNTGELLIIHVYFTKNGLYQHTKAKIYTSSESRENGKIVLLSSEQLAQVQENIIQPITKVGLLIKENHSLYNQAVDSAREIERKLDVPPKNVDDYYIQAQAYIDKIALINRYSYGSKDQRGLLMAKHIAHMKNLTLLDSEQDEIIESPLAIVEEKHLQTLKEKESDSMTQVSPINTATKIRKVPEKYLRTEKLIQEITKSQSAIRQTPQDLTLLINYNDLINELNSYLLLLSSTSSKLPNKERRNVKKWMSNNYEKYDLLSLFMNYFWQGDIDAIQVLFPHIGHLITITDINNILIKLVRNKPPLSKEEKLEKAFNFLYENSNTYHLLMQADYVYMTNETGTRSFSPLLVAYLEKNFFAYKMLLAHGISPNAPGFLYENLQVTSINAMMMMYDGSSGLPYLQLAIEYGALYANAEPFKEGFKISLAADSSVTQKLTNKIKGNFQKSIYKQGIMNGDLATLQKPIIECCCLNDRFEGLELFLPQMTLDHMLDALAYITNLSSTNKRCIIPAIEQGCQVLIETNRLMERHLALVDFEKKYNFFSLLIYGNNTAALEFTEKLLKQIKIKILNLSENSPLELKRMQEEALLATQSVKTRGESYKFERCLFLYMLEPTPNFMTYQVLLQLYCRQAQFMSKTIYTNEATANFQIAKLIAEETLFSSQLMKTKLYDFIMKKLPEKTISESRLKL
jgi:hypothetical protein